ncbi:MAG: membrane dipeptidase [Clostridia bacterium]|nr:membrane dipeptidase [Clostridia bacterium]
MYVFDAHCDYLWSKQVKGQSVLECKNENESKIKKSIFAVFEGKNAHRELVNRQIDEFSKQKPVEEAFIAFEGLSWAENRGDADILQALSPVYVGPMWNRKNHFGGSCYEDGELTPFGKCFLSQLDENGIFIDLAHSGERMFFSCFDEFENLMFSHGNVYSVCPHKRNLKTNQIKKLIQRDCFLGLTLFADFVGDEKIEKLLEHVEAVLDAGGENILGFGSDLDGCESIVGKNKNLRVFEEIQEELSRRNYSKTLKEKIFHGNLERCLNKNKKIGQREKKSLTK